MLLIDVKFRIQHRCLILFRKSRPFELSVAISKHQFTKQKVQCRYSCNVNNEYNTIYFQRIMYKIVRFYFATACIPGRRAGRLFVLPQLCRARDMQVINCCERQLLIDSAPRSILVYISVICTKCAYLLPTALNI